MEEIFEREVDARIDEKIKPIINIIQSHETQLKRLQQFVAYFHVIDEANKCRTYVFQTKPDTPASFYSQLVVQTTSSINEINTSDDPLSVAWDFTVWCAKEQNKLGVTIINLPTLNLKKP